MARSLHWYTKRLLLCIPLVSLCGIVILLSSCDERRTSKSDCPKAAIQNHNAHSGHEIGMVKPLSAFVVILVMSGPRLLAGRQVLRETWLSLRTSDVLVRFVIGTAGISVEQMQILKNEQEEYRDLLLLPDLQDGFLNLTQKLINMLVWLDKNVDYEFLLKVDDDSFVRLDAILAELQEKSREKLFWGFFDGRAHVHRAGKYAETNWVLCDRYLPYAKGGGYVISADLIHFISSNAKYLKKYNGEDVSLGSWLAAIEVNRQHDPRFDTEYKSRGCFNSYLITHKQSPNDMRQKWDHYRRTRNLCVKEFQTRPSYIYDWQKPPTECCKREMGIP